MNCKAWQNTAVLTLLITLGFMHSAAASTESSEAVGYVYDLTPPCAEITLQREGRLHELTLSEHVSPGDVIRLQKCTTGAEEPHITINYFNGEVEKIAAHASPFTVPNINNDEGMLATLQKWGSAFMQASKDRDNKEGILTSGKGKPPANDAPLPITLPWGNIEALVAPDRDELSIYWLEGVGPFSIHAATDQGEQVTSGSIAQRSTFTVPFPKSAHYINITVTPSSGNPATARVRRASNEEWNAIRKGVGSGHFEQLSADIRSLMMMTETSGALVLEAYQQVSQANAEPSSTPSLVKRMIETGILPGVIRGTDQ